MIPIFMSISRSHFQGTILKITANSISLLQADLGFEDLSHFSFTFKKLFGLTPTELTVKKK